MKHEIEVAAKWWTDQLRETPRHDNGDGMQSAMMNYLARHLDPIPEDKIERFEVSLKEILANQEHLYCVGVDYRADPRLQEACIKAEIESKDRFPVKTKMWIEQGKVSVSRGYRAPIEILYELK